MLCKIRIITGLLAFLFCNSSCSQLIDVKYSHEFHNIPLFDSADFHYLTNVFDSFDKEYYYSCVADYINTHVKYKKDEEGDNASTPEETLNKNEGDCEDFALLFMNIVYLTSSVKLDLVLTNTTNKKIDGGGYINHAVVKDNNGTINPQTGLYKNYASLYFYPFEDVFLIR